MLYWVKRGSLFPKELNNRNDTKQVVIYTWLLTTKKRREKKRKTLFCREWRDANRSPNDKVRQRPESKRSVCHMLETRGAREKTMCTPVHKWKIRPPKRAKCNPIHKKNNLALVAIHFCCTSCHLLQKKSDLPPPPPSSASPQKSNNDNHMNLPT